MKLKLTTKNSQTNIFFCINWELTIKNEDLNNFVKNFKLNKKQNFKIEQINKINKKWKKENFIIIFIKNNKDLENNIEEIVSQVWNNIKKSKQNFYLSLKKIDKRYQQLLVELFAQKLYNFTHFKKDENKNILRIATNLDIEKTNKKINSIYFARNIMNMPWSTLNPDEYERILKEEFKENKNIKIKTIKWEELKKIWAEWIHAVWKWSIHQGRMIILEYKPKKNEDFLWLAWKWVTFDTWGYNIKPTNYIEEMHLDMWGSAVCLWIFKYLTDIWFEKNIVCWVWIVESRVSNNSFLPTDIVKMYNWKTVKVTNTDAEWRIVLWDTMSYMEDKYNISHLFDIATLTWAAIVALWWEITPIMWRNHQLIKKIQKKSWEIKERCWELPLYKKYNKWFKDDFADLSNLAKWWAGTITAGLFLSNFVQNKNWVHFDIAWPWITQKDKIYDTGGSGIWIRLISNIIENLK